MLHAVARAPALAIAEFVRRSGGAAYSSQILTTFGMSQSSLRRRRHALRRLGIVFIENGAGSLYATEELARTASSDSQSITDQLPAKTRVPHAADQRLAACSDSTPSIRARPRWSTSFPAYWAQLEARQAAIWLEDSFAFGFADRV
jgi:hypothetical protein